MIEVACSSCGKRYRIDDEKIKGESAKLRCRACGEVFTIHKPAAVPEPEPPPASPKAEVPPHPPESASGTADIGVKEETVQVQADAFIGEGPKIRFGLASRIIALMLVVSLLPLGVYWGINFMDTSDRVRRNNEILMEQIARGLGSQVDEWIDKNVRVIKTAARLSEIVSMNQLRQEPVLKAICAEYPWIYLAFTVDPEGMNRARNDGKPLKDYSDRQYYKDVIRKGKALTWQTLIGKTSKKPALILAVPIRSEGRTVGVMAAAMNIDRISKSVAAWKRGKTGFAFLVDEKGKVVSHQIQQYVKTQKILTGHPMIQAFRREKRPVTMSFTSEKGNPTLGHVRGNDFGWALVAQQEHKEVFQTLKDIQRFSIILLVITVIGVTVIAWFLARRVTRPIMKLTDAAEQMSLGNLNVDIGIKSRDEIGLLAQALARMQTSLRLAIARLRKRA